MKLLTALSLALVSSTAITIAQAAPHECRHNRREYRHDVIERMHELKRVWRHKYNKDCSFQDEFKRTHGQMKQVQGHDRWKCKILADNKGREMVLEAIRKQCSHEGDKFGSEDGRRHGEEYCASQETLGFFSVGDFEIRYSESCKRSFIQHAEQNCPQKKANDSSFNQTVETKCSLGE